MSFCCDPEYFVDIGEFGTISIGTEFCIECGRLIPQGEAHYRMFEWIFGEFMDERIHMGTHAICEKCGDLALSWLELGYCWSYGGLREDITEMRR